MLKLYQFPRAKDFPNYSPYCVKLETYLKIAKIPYENIFTLDLSKNPKGMMPYIELEGKFLGDSSFIMDELIKLHGDKVDNWLTQEQKAVSMGFQRLLENHLATMMIYFRWVYPEGWIQFGDAVFQKAPKLVKLIIGYKLQKKVERRLKSNSATAGFTVAELLQRCEKDFDALSNYLGQKNYLLGDEVIVY